MQTHGLRLSSSWLCWLGPRAGRPFGRVVGLCCQPEGGVETGQMGEVRLLVPGS